MFNGRCQQTRPYLAQVACGGFGSAHHQCGLPRFVRGHFGGNVRSCEGWVTGRPLHLKHMRPMTESGSVGTAPVKGQPDRATQYDKVKVAGRMCFIRLSPVARTCHERQAVGSSPDAARSFPAGLRVGRAFYSSVHA